MENYKKKFQFITFHIKVQNQWFSKPLRIRVTKLDGFIISLDGKIKHLVLFDYRLLDKISDKVKHIISKKVVLQKVSIIILVGSELIHIILCLLIKNYYYLFIMQ